MKHALVRLAMSIVAAGMVASCSGTSGNVAGKDGGQDAGEPLVFACGLGSLTCDSATQYCWVIAGGPISPDGGTSETTQCLPLPSSCTGTDATCACLETVAAGTCTVAGAGITMTDDAG
jgi:hypothetical protein